MVKKKNMGTPSLEKHGAYLWRPVQIQVWADSVSWAPARCHCFLLIGTTPASSQNQPIRRGHNSGPAFDWLLMDGLTVACVLGCANANDYAIILKQLNKYKKQNHLKFVFRFIIISRFNSYRDGEAPFSLDIFGQLLKRNRKSLLTNGDAGAAGPGSAREKNVSLVEKT